MDSLGAVMAVAIDLHLKQLLAVVRDFEDQDLVMGLSQVALGPMVTLGRLAGHRLLQIT